MQQRSTIKQAPNGATTVISTAPTVVTGLGNVGNTNTINLYDGVTATGSPVLQGGGDFNATAIPFGAGVVFPNGCTASVPAGADQCVFFYTIK